ncbi:MAG TPA: PepSY domain-containing protein, partial [Azospira sp.]|nr:PepSY domain-containing protein [Azospira sp.]
MTSLRRRCRAWLLALHRWLGLSLGLLFCLLGASGSLLVFYGEGDRFLNPELQLRPAGPPHDLDAVYALLQAAHPQRSGGWRLELPMAPEQPVTARYYGPAEKAGLDFAPLLVAVDPYRLEIVSQRFWGEFAATWLYNLHFTLLLDRSGRLLLGVAAVLLVLLLGLGTYLWWPSPGRLGKALRPGAGRSSQRRIYDLHVLGGLYGLPLLLLLTLSGAVLEQPAWFKPLLAVFSPVDAVPAPAAEHGAVLIGPQQARAIALGRVPGAEVRWLETPPAGGGNYRLRLYQPGDPSRRFPHTLVWIDAASGEVLAIRDPRQDSAADSLFNWLQPLHNGEAFGLPGRLLTALAGLLPLLLFY